MNCGKKPQTPPPLSPSRSRHEKQSVYLASLEAAGPNFLEKAFDAYLEPPPYAPIFYFFYGTLTKPHILKHVLGLKEEPILRPARVLGYSLVSWGQYPALIDGDTGEEVKGFAYEVQTIEQEYKLAQYETSAYKVEPCWIRFTDMLDEDSAKVMGQTFMYAGDSAALRAGRFDRTLWELQMGLRLPDSWRTPAPPLNVAWGSGSVAADDSKGKTRRYK